MDKENAKEEIKQMDVGQTIAFPVERVAVIRTYAWEIGMVMNREYKTSTDKIRRVVEVKRIS